MLRTRVTPTKDDFDAVRTTVASSQMQRLMHIAHEMNEKLERLQCLPRSHRVGAGAGGRRRPADKVGEDRRDVLDGVEDVAARISFPAVRTGEETVVRGVVAGSADVVQRRRPPHVVAVLVGPGGHGRKVARWVAVGADHRVTIGREDGTDGVEDIWAEVRLGDGRDYLMAFTG